MFQPTFIGKEKDEKVILSLRRHWTCLLKYILIFLVLFLIPLILYSLIYYFIPSLLNWPIYQILILLGGLYFPCLWLYLFIKWMDYYFDVWMITDRRLVNIEQISLFHRKVSVTDLLKIQDVTVEVEGFFAMLFKYGNIIVQTAGTAPAFEIKDISQPYKVRDIIFRQLHKMQEKCYSPENVIGPGKSYPKEIIKKRA